MRIEDSEQMSDDDPIKIKGQEIANKFSEMVDKLRSSSNPRLAALGKLTWRLVGNRVVPFAVSEDVKVIGLGIIVRGDIKLGVIMAPMDWLEQIESNPVNAMGGVVFVSSKARDYWNGKIVVPSEEDECRAIAYEAEYLLTNPNLVPNDYQQKVLDKFPNGLASAPELVYQGKPYMDAV
jgi:hypothetical protein